MFYQWQRGDLLISCRIQPNARQDGFAEVSDDTLKIQIAAPPADGKANQHLIKFLSGQFRTPQRQITIERGASSRNKRIRIHAPKQLPSALHIAEHDPDA